jgi:DNA-binding response OmpR family regulator
MRLLIVEDDIALCKGIELALNKPGVKIFPCFSLAEAKIKLRNELPDLMVLDINLPDGSGLDFCAELRSAGLDVPILMLTANDTELDMVAGLSSGADDYVTKPFSLAVLRARVDALLRRGTAHAGEQVSIDGFVFDFPGVRFEKDGNTVELSKTEARLLQMLVANKGQTLTRDQLLSKIWSDDTEYVDENALSVAIWRLRSKLEDNPSNPEYIRTVHGIGYKWVVNL